MDMAERRDTAFWNDRDQFAGTTAVQAAVSEPNHCKRFLDKIAEKLGTISEATGTHHLAFLNGSVVTLLFAALVNRTEWPAAIYSCDGSGRFRFFAGTAPNEDDKVVLVVDDFSQAVDLEIVRQGLLRVANAQLVGVVVISGDIHGRGVKRHTPPDDILIDEVVWREHSGRTRGNSVGSGEMRELSASRHEPIEDNEMKQDQTAGTVPPGVYSFESLPDLNPDVRAMIEDIEQKAREARIARGEPAEVDVDALRTGYEPLTFGDLPSPKVINFDVTRR